MSILQFLAVPLCQGLLTFLPGVATQPSDFKSQMPASSSRIMHFVTGGFSGATSVAVDLANAARSTPELNATAILVLRRKRNMPMHRVDALRQAGLDVHIVSGWSHWRTIVELRRLCLQWQPDVLVAHGFPEHLIGRYAGWLAGIRSLVQVEHNSRERYTWLKLRQALWLSQRTKAIIGVSESVCENLRQLGFPAERIHAVPNGVDVTKFAAANSLQWADRKAQVVMCARFASQKDHATLIRAAALLKSQGIDCPVLLAGGGKPRYRRQAERLCRSLGLDDGQVQFLGVCDKVPELLGQSRVAVLSTHYEGMPLTLIEAMAAGCVAIGSDVPGVRDVIAHRVNGLLVPHQDAQRLAQAIATALQDREVSEACVRAGQTSAQRDFSKALSAQRHHALYRQ